MPTTITLPEALANELQRRAAAEHCSVETLAIASIAAGLNEPPEQAGAATAFDPSPELLELVAQIQAAPRDPASIVPAKGELAAVLRALAAMAPDVDDDLAAEISALDAAEAELRAINRADDVRDGRG